MTYHVYANGRYIGSIVCRLVDLAQRVRIVRVYPIGNAIDVEAR